MDKQNFFLFRRKRKDGDGYEYIQHLVSPSCDNGLSCSCWPEFAWRGQGVLDIRKMEYLMSISKNYDRRSWELVEYKMEVEQHSWALKPKCEQYENFYKNEKFRRLTKKEEEELEEFKKLINKRWKIEDTLTKETLM